MELIKGCAVPIFATGASVSHDEMWALALAINNSLPILKSKKLSVDSYKIGESSLRTQRRSIFFPCFSSFFNEVMLNPAISIFYTHTSVALGDIISVMFVHALLFPLNLASAFRSQCQHHRKKMSSKRQTVS